MTSWDERFSAIKNKWRTVLAPNNGVTWGQKIDFQLKRKYNRIFLPTFKYSNNKKHVISDYYIQTFKILQISNCSVGRKTIFSQVRCELKPNDFRPNHLKAFNAERQIHLQLRNVFGANYVSANLSEESFLP